MPAVAKSVILRIALYFVGPMIPLVLGWGAASVGISFSLATLAALLHFYYRNIYVPFPVFLLRLAAFTAFVLMLAVVFRGPGPVHLEAEIPVVESHPEIPMVGKLASSDFLSSKPVVTMSIVLPCANEGQYSWKTSQSIAEVTPTEVLHEIIVVDDGSSPPLISQFPKEIVEKAKVRFVRHETHTGLINAKAAGANVATGDIVVFLDCHVRPAPEWHVSIIEKIRSNYRRVVVPSITALDPDTWEEIRGGGGMAKCYLTWDADFKWFDSDDDSVGIMSGGLLAMSRQWWTETGGYDTAMRGWGGENIDQSLRIWLCGGEIVQARDSFVGHMWRTHDKPQTKAHYSIPAGSVNTNRYRGASVWMGEWSEKLETYAAFSQFVSHKPDVSNIQSIKDKLQCKHFSYFIDKFYKVYHWGGLLPTKVFRLRDSMSGLCVERQGAESIILSQCSEANTGQLWHRSNRDGKKCCSGYRNWNSDQCLAGGWIGSKVRTFVCNVGGFNTDQFVTLNHETHQLEFPKVAGACVGGNLINREKATFIPCSGNTGSISQSFTKKTAAKNLHTLASPENKDDSKIEIVRLEDSQRPGLCLAAMGGESVGRIEMHDCDETSPLQNFAIQTLPSGQHRLQALGLVPTEGHAFTCVDAGLGNEQVALYPCYTDDNINQNVEIVSQTNKESKEDEVVVKFRFKNDFCLSFPKPVDEPEPEPITLHGCIVNGNVVKRGQYFDRVFLQANDTSVFYLKNRDGKCLSPNAHRSFIVTHAACQKDPFKQDPNDPHKRLRHIPSNLCLDGGDGTTPSLYSCYTDTNLNQQVDVSNGYVKVHHSQTCLDFEPVTPSDANVVACPLAQTLFHWEEYQAFVPLETQLYLNHKEKTGGTTQTPAP